MNSKIVLPRNWGLVASLLDLVPNSVLAGSIVDHILLSDDPGSTARVLKDLDLEMAQQDYLGMLGSLGIHHDGTPAKSIVSGDLSLNLVKFDLHPDVTIYQGSYGRKPVDLFVIPSARAYETRFINGFPIRMQTVESRKQVIEAICSIENPKGMAEGMWLRGKKERLAKRNEMLDMKFKGGEN